MTVITIPGDFPSVSLLLQPNSWAEIPYSNSSQIG